MHSIWGTQLLRGLQQDMRQVLAAPCSQGSSCGLQKEMRLYPANLLDSPCKHCTSGSIACSTSSDAGCPEAAAGSLCIKGLGLVDLDPSDLSVPAGKHLAAANTTPFCAGVLEAAAGKALQLTQ